MDTKKSNILYSVYFFGTIIILFSFFGYAFISAKAANRSYTEDYNKAMVVNGYKVKISEAVYITDTQEFAFVFSVLADSGVNKDAYPYISEVRKYDKKKNMQQFLPEYIYSERNNLSRYVYVSGVPDDFMFMSVYCTSLIPEYQDPPKKDAFGDEIPGEIHKEILAIQYCNIDRRDIKFMTKEEANKLLVKKENESQLDDSSTVESDSNSEKTYEDVSFADDSSDDFSEAETTKPEVFSPQTSSSAAYSSSETPDSTDDNTVVYQPDNGGGGGGGGGGGYDPTPYEPTTTTTTTSQATTTAPSTTAPRTTTTTRTTTIPRTTTTPRTTTAPQTQPVVIHPDRIRIESDYEDNNVVISVGQDTVLRAIVEPFEADNRDVIWKSNKPNIAEVDEDGKVTGKSKGKAIITAETVDGGLKASIMITVS